MRTYEARKLALAQHLEYQGFCNKLLATSEQFQVLLVNCIVFYVVQSRFS